MFNSLNIEFWAAQGWMWSETLSRHNEYYRTKSISGFILLYNSV
jgi:hypothetical protein